MHPPSDAPDPDDAPAEGGVDAAFAAYLRGCDAGEIESREAFLSKFPELAGQLKELMEAADLIGQMSQPGSRGPSPGSTPLPNARALGTTDAAGDFSVGTSREPGAMETRVGPSPGESGVDPAVTLPVAGRRDDDPGPRLPFDLGDYLLIEEIGRGGMGVVYRAEQKELQREVAVKMIRSGALAGDDEVRRFETEAKAAARLNHPGIVSVHHSGRRVGHHFFSMEYVQGVDLQKRIQAGTLSPDGAARYVRDVAVAIQHAHEKGVLHRDLKPANVLIDKDDRMRVTDFGLAKNLDRDSSVTGSGAAIGTPHYMAPEQASGHADRVTVRSDVYALGAILFAALAGRPPLVGDTVMQTLHKVIHEPAPAIRSVRGDIPVDLQTIIAKCLEKRPAARYMSAAALASDLQAYLEGRPIAARPRGLLVRAANWLTGIPVVGAVTGRRVLHSSDHHRRVQAAMLLLLLLSPMLISAALIYRARVRDAMPTMVRIAGGIESGIYTGLSDSLARRLEDRFGVATSVHGSGGSLDNRESLDAGTVQLAPMQATAIAGESLCVVAPLFYESLYILADVTTEIRRVEDLRGHRVAVGPPGSGSRAAAELIFDSLGIADAGVQREVIAWDEMSNMGAPEAAMICIGRGSRLLPALMQPGRWRLIGVPDAVKISLQHPTLRAMTIRRGDVPETLADQIPERGLPTVGTTAYLATRVDAPAELITGTLAVLYADPPLLEDLIPRRRAAEWQGLAFHPAARAYFSVPATER